MRISGHWFSAESSTRHVAELVITGKHYQLQLDGTAQAQGELDELEFSDRVGDTQRKLYWPDGAMFESTDNKLIDQLLENTGHRNARSGIIHRLENSGRFALLSLLLVAAIAFSTFRWGIPLAAKQIAFRLPVSAMATISTGTFDTLDEYFFEPSELEDTRQAEIETRFSQLVASLPDEGFNYRLYFRKLEDVPNAIALPSGQVVVTDALVKMIEAPQELDSILLHEIGHVVERHGVQSVVRASALSLIAALAIGDVSGTAELIAGLPVFLMQSSYSRESESAADSFAFAQMVELGIDPAFFASIIERMSGVVAIETEKEVPEYFSSHPDSRTRAIKARRYSEEHFSAGQ